MSAIADEARVSLFVADYAAADAAGKLNILGAGWTLTAIDHQTGNTADRGGGALIDIPPKFYGDDYAVELVLRDSAGSPVAVNGPAGQPQTIQIAQSVRVEEPQFAAGANVPRRTVCARQQLTIQFGNGLPLSPGELYEWTLRIDGIHRPGWAVSFFVAGQPPGPVFGGPSGPSTIPELGPHQ